MRMIRLLGRSVARSSCKRLNRYDFFYGGTFQDGSRRVCIQQRRVHDQSEQPREKISAEERWTDLFLYNNCTAPPSSS